MRVAVLASGNGSNFEALVTALNHADSPAQVVSLITNNPEAKCIERAQRLKVDTLVVNHKTFAGKVEYETRIADALDAQNIMLVCLAGYMRLIGPTLLGRFSGKIINIHPSLLPAFPGLNAIKQAHDARVRVTGVTVHYVDEGTDTGPIIAQQAVPIRPLDTEETLADKIHAVEHALFPRVVEGIARNEISLEGRTVRYSGSFV